jgi:hypothetical protein
MYMTYVDDAYYMTSNCSWNVYKLEENMFEIHNRDFIQIYFQPIFFNPNWKMNMFQNQENNYNMLKLILGKIIA